MAVFFGTLYFASMMFLIVMASTLAVPAALKPMIVFQEDLPNPKSTAHAKQVTIGKPTSTMTTMTGGGPEGLSFHDVVKKTIEPQPDSHRQRNNYFRRTTTVAENLKTENNGTNVGHINSDKEFHSIETKNVVHKDGRSVTKTVGEINHEQKTTTHRLITENDRKVHVDTADSCERCNQLTRSLEEGKDSALKRSHEETGMLKTHYLKADTHVHGKSRTADGEKHETSFKHLTQQKMGTKQMVSEGKENLMLGTMHDIHTETISGKHAAESNMDVQDTPEGKLTKNKHIVKSNLKAADVQEHYMNAYHDTPLHKFIMKNKLVRDDQYREQSLEADYNTELQRKDGTKINTHVQKKTNLDSSRLQHVDELNIKAINKEHPDHPAEVSLKTRIVDRDHLKLTETNRKSIVATLPNGGHRSMSINEERDLSQNLKTDPTDRNHVDKSLPLEDQVHKVEKTVVPANGKLMTPLVQEYKIVKME